MKLEKGNISIEKFGVDNNKQVLFIDIMNTSVTVWIHEKNIHIDVNMNDGDRVTAINTEDTLMDRKAIFSKDLNKWINLVDLHKSKILHGIPDLREG